jgi:hypothetical protein
MFKKSVASLLILLYTGTVMGFALTVHYCGNIRASVKVNETAKNCGMNKMAGKMKCCKDSRLDVKVKDSHQQAGSSFLVKITPVEISQLFDANFLFPAQPLVAGQLSGRAPPDAGCLHAVPSYLKYRNLRI